MGPKQTQSASKTTRGRWRIKTILFLIIGIVVYGGIMYVLFWTRLLGTEYRSLYTSEIKKEEQKPARPALDIADYDKRMNILAHIKVSPATSTASTTVAVASTTPKLWPATAVRPLGGALLPFNRILAYYGNFYSRQMGILGEFEPNEVLEKLKTEQARWELADPSTPVLPAIEYIAVTAQGSAGDDGKYRLRMPSSQIDQAIDMAEKINGIVILDLQVGLSTLQAEVPLLEKYLKMPQVHLAVDPEFDMKTGAKPGTVIGTVDASDINYVSNYLASLVKEYDLPPKILIVHRFTQAMVTNYKNIQTLPEVQIVMDMDGWGGPSMKERSYIDYIYDEPVQFTGIKLFYKNDLKNGSSGLMTPREVMDLMPRPIYIQYQ